MLLRLYFLHQGVEWMLLISQAGTNNFIIYQFHFLVVILNFVLIFFDPFPADHSQLLKIITRDYIKKYQITFYFKYLISIHDINFNLKALENMAIGVYFILWNQYHVPHKCTDQHIQLGFGLALSIFQESFYTLQLIKALVTICAIFLLLIKSMSKIQNISRNKHNFQLQENQNSSALSNGRTAFRIKERSIYSDDNDCRSPSHDFLESQQQDFKCSKQTEVVKFSRFKHWSLIQSIDNNEICREMEENKLSSQKNIQQQEQLFSQSNLEIGTVIPIDKFDIQKTTNSRLNYSRGNKNGSSLEERKGKPKEKGLRKLSGKAFNIVKELGEATYKEVALKLIKQIKQQGLQYQNQDQQQQKQQNNIKRRVYDALNVLIAMGFLHKKGRNIVYDQNTQMIKEQKCYFEFMEQKSKMQCQIRKRVQDLKKKKQQIKSIQNKANKIKNLIQRNKFTNQLLTASQIIMSPDSRIHFPFVCLIVPIDSKQTMRFSEDSKQFTLNTPYDKYQYMGDIDFISKLAIKHYY